jgi:hypothetical protein
VLQKGTSQSANEHTRFAITDLKPIFARTRSNAAQTARATSAPPLSLERYAGTYVDSAYGNVNVTFQNGTLQAAVVTDPAVPLDPVSFEAFRTKPSEGGRAMVLTFVPDGNGGVSGVRVFNILFDRERDSDERNRLDGVAAPQQSTRRRYP